MPPVRACLYALFYRCRNPALLSTDDRCFRVPVHSPSPPPDNASAFAGRQSSLPIVSRSHWIRRTPEHLKRSEEHTSELQSRENLVCRLLLEKKKKTYATLQHVSRATESR